LTPTFEASFIKNTAGCRILVDALLAWAEARGARAQKAIIKGCVILIK